MIKLRLTPKLIIFSLFIAALMLAIATFFLNQPPHIVDYYPKNNQYFSYVHIKLNKPIQIKDLQLSISPQLQTSPPYPTSNTEITWLIKTPPTQNTTYTFTLKYKQNTLFTWQTTTPNKPFDIGSYPDDVVSDLDKYLQKTQLLQLLPPPNPYFFVKYHNENHITIYPIHPDKNLAAQKAKDWLNSLPPTINKAKLRIDWAP